MVILGRFIKATDGSQFVIQNVMAINRIIIITIIIFISIAIIDMFMGIIYRYIAHCFKADLMESNCLYWIWEVEPTHLPLMEDIEKIP